MSMKKLSIATLAGLAFVVLVAAASDVTGKWDVDVKFDDSSVKGGGIDCVFKQNGEQLTGNCAAGGVPLTGEIKGQNIRWQTTAWSDEVTIVYSGIVDEAGTSMKGSFTIDGKGGSFTALKSK
jgi:hypothetical protein